MNATLIGDCVQLPCSAERFWVIPQKCLGEIVTVAATEDQPPVEVSWRGETVPVVDFGAQDPVPWRDPRGGSGLVAILLGQRNEGCRFFGVAVRGGNLGFRRLTDDNIEDVADVLPDYTTAAFRMEGNLYQVPDLLALQRAIATGERVAQQ